jgi:hypothetical protein
MHSLTCAHCHFPRLGPIHKYKEIVAKLQKSIEAPGKVLMLLHPWNQPIVLSRAW